MTTPAQRELLIVWYWASVGLPGRAPEWVVQHPLAPWNNDTFIDAANKVSAGRLATPVQGRDRLWEAIVTEFGLDLNADQAPTKSA